MSTSDSPAHAQSLKPRTDVFTGVVAGWLPRVNCEYCGQTLGTGVEFPLVLASHFAGSVWHRPNRAKGIPHCSWKEFESLVEQARIVCKNSDLTVRPMAALGPIVIETEPANRWPRELMDVHWSSPGGLLISNALLLRLEARGIRLEWQPTQLMTADKRGHPYGLMQAEVYPILHPHTLSENFYEQCKFCGKVKVLDFSRKPTRRIYLQEALRPRVGPLFRVVGYEQVVFVSDDMKVALEALSPSGLRFEAIGMWE